MPCRAASGTWWVEDNAAEQLSIAELLGYGGIDIAVVDAGAAALASTQPDHLTAWCLTCRLPDMSGFEVLERLRGDAALTDVPVVVFTDRVSRRRTPGCTRWPDRGGEGRRVAGTVAG